jgi:cytochrome c oxidase subunit IV
MAEQVAAKQETNRTPEHGTHHVVPLWLYRNVFWALMVLLVLTLVAAHYNLGEMNLVIAVTIAVVKAVIIVLYFMHLRWSTWMVRLFAGAAFFWLMILFVLTLDDYFSRPWFTPR